MRAILLKRAYAAPCDGIPIIIPNGLTWLVRKESARVKSLPVCVPEFARLIVPT